MLQVQDIVVKTTDSSLRGWNLHKDRFRRISRGNQLLSWNSFTIFTKTGTKQLEGKDEQETIEEFFKCKKSCQPP